jgi:kynureninase
MAVTLAECHALDEADELARFRDLFTLPEGVIYLDGNSLGARPRAATARVMEVMEREWGEGLIRSWNDAGWMATPARIGDKIAQLIGAPAGSVMVGDSTSVNLFKMLAVALAARPDRRVIVSERRNFPTDLYIAEGLAALLGRGHTLRLVEPDGVLAAIDETVAVVMLTHVNYHTGAMHDMAAITAATHRAGAISLWDLCHSVGAVPVDLTAAGADLAVGCGYKYLNGGPGAPAFLYIAPELQQTARHPMTGWLGHAAPFAFEPSYRPAPGITRAVVGTPMVLSLAALEVGVDIALQAPMAALRGKSLRQADLFAQLVAERCGATFRRVTPLAAEQRGSQICLVHENAYEIMQALIARGVIGDFRAPDILRFGFTPLYLRYQDVFAAVEALVAVMRNEEWRRPQYAVRRAVT